MSNTHNILEKINQVISSNGLCESILSFLNKGHAKANETMALFKLLLIQRYYDLNDHEMLDAVADRLSFSSFVSLSPTDPTVTTETIRSFRKKLLENGFAYSLYSQLDNALFKSGIILKRGKQKDLAEINESSSNGIGGPEGSNERLFEVFVDDYPYPIQLRADTSDLPTYQEVMRSELYQLDLRFSPEFIIDCGANIGLTSVYFKWQHPDAKIIAIEPEASNFRLLDRNVSYYYPDIETIMAGVWDKSTWLSVKDGQNPGHWSYVVNEETEQTDRGVRSVTIAELLKKYQRTGIDILKVDIEGAEKEIFENNYEEWLPHTKVIMVETHDRFKKGCSTSVLKAISSYDFSITPRGNILVCIRQ